MSMFALPSSILVLTWGFLFAASVVATSKLARTCHLPRDPLPFSLALLIGLLFAFPRGAYLYEHVFGGVVDGLLPDDTWHIQEISSLVNTPYFPPLSTFQSQHYLSFYYAPWMFTAFIYKALPFSFVTIKTALLVTYLVYLPLFLHTFVVLSACLFAERWKQWLFLYVVMFNGGLVEAVLFVTEPFVHHQWWLHDFLGMQLQFPCFVTSIEWAVHHVSAGIALILAWLMLEIEGSAIGFAWRGALIGVLFAYAFYSSVFVILGAAPFGVALACRTWTREKAITLLLAVVTSAIVIFPSAWMYLGKNDGFLFLQNTINKGPLCGIQPYWLWLSVSAVVYTACVSTEFVPQIVLICIRSKGRSTNWTKAVLLTLVGLLFGAFFLVNFSGWNNLAMRGVFVPGIVLSYLAVADLECEPLRKATKVCVGLVLLIAAVGSVNELGLVYARATDVLAIKDFDHTFPLPEARKAIYQLNANRTRHVVSLKGSPLEPVINSENELFCMVEKVIKDHHKPLVLPDMELIHPKGPWYWEDWQRNHRCQRRHRKRTDCERLAQIETQVGLAHSPEYNPTRRVKEEEKQGSAWTRSSFQRGKYCLKLSSGMTASLAG
jgi:hypothetical protein